MEFKFLVLLFASYFVLGTAEAGAATKCDQLTVKRAGSALRPTPQRIRTLLERYQYSNESVIAELPGARHYSRLDRGDLLLCPQCGPFVDRMVAYLSNHTPPISGFEFSNAPTVDDGVIAQLIVNRRGVPLGGYLYLIRQFQEIGHPENRSSNWSSGYFDKDGNFMGRGTGQPTELNWSFY